VDIYGGIEWKNNIGVSLGVDNVFDKQYAEFVTKNHVEVVAPKTINAPERTFWLRVNAAF
ncbi:MAG: TonB-dependent receptor, partial [Deltaproteobacteria bacterium]